MSASVLVCLDQHQLENEKDLSQGFRLLSKKGLLMEQDAQSARSAAQNPEITECWVGDVRDMPALNLAAALKHDAQNTPVFLMSQFAQHQSEAQVKAARLSGIKQKQDLIRLMTDIYTRHLRCSQIQQEDPWEETDTTLSERPQFRRINPSQSSTQRVFSQNSSGAGVRPPASVSGATKPVLSSVSQASPDERQTQQRPVPAKPCSQFSLVGKKAYVLVVAGAQGACGKSTVASLAAFRGQAWGYKTLIIDADLQFGDLKYLCTGCPSVSIDELVCTPHLMGRLKPSGDYPALITAPSAAEQAEQLAQELPKIVEAASQVFDLIVVNTGSFWAEEQALLFEMASQVLFLVDQRPNALRSTEHALHMCARCNIATRGFLFALNRSSKQSVLKVVDIQGIFDGVGCVELKDGGTDVEICLAAGKPLDLIRSGNSLVISLDAILREILPRAQARQINMPSNETRPRNKRRGVLRGRAACLC